MSTPATDISPVTVRSLAEVTAAHLHRPRTRTAPPRPESESRLLRIVTDFGPEPTGLGDLPDPRHVAARIGTAVFEASIGARPATQVMRWLAPEVYDSIVRRSGRAARAGRATRRPVRLRRVHAHVVETTTPAAIVEACVVLDDHRRVRTMALRLEGLDGRWLVTACEIG